MSRTNAAARSGRGTAATSADHPPDGTDTRWLADSASAGTASNARPIAVPTTTATSAAGSHLCFAIGV